MNIYHYHATYQMSDGTHHIDGIIQCEYLVDSMERYAEIKRAINQAYHNKLIIESLTPLPSTPRTPAANIALSDLHGVIDAKVWRDEFCRLHPQCDPSDILNWFASALVSGIDVGYSSARGEVGK